jgi:predicted nucleotidyltransferase
MNYESTLSPKQRVVLDRFVTACETDNRIVAAFLGGSYARDKADSYSDLDLYLITTDKDFDNFCAQREAFLQLLGEPVFIEDFDIPNIVFFIFSDGTEGELGFGHESQFDHIHKGNYKVLVDKECILAGTVFTGRDPDPAGQTEKLRRQIYWFWHDLSHFTTSMGRGQLWWARSQLEELRRYCINLARLSNNFLDKEAGDEAYFKLENILPVEQLSALRATFCPLQADEMVNSCLTIIEFYRKLAIPLAREHEIVYPDVLERVMMKRLEEELLNQRRPPGRRHLCELEEYG